MKVTPIGWTKTEASKTRSDVYSYIMDDGKTYNFKGWNGEEWGDWWEEMNPDNCGTCARPVYRFDLEDIDLDTLEENGDEWNAATEIVEIDLM